MTGGGKKPSRCRARLRFASAALRAASPRSKKSQTVLDSIALIGGITSISMQPTDLELKQLRGKGGPTGKMGAMNTILKVGNSFAHSPGGGLAADGTRTVKPRRSAPLNVAGIPRRASTGETGLSCFMQKP